MKRREFLGACSLAGLSALTGSPLAALAQAADATAVDGTSGLLIADPHAHPYRLHSSRSNDSSAPSIDMLKTAGVALCSFSAVGDMTFYKGRSGTPFSDTQNQLSHATRLVDKGELRLVLSRADVQTLKPAPEIPSGFLAIEGGDALEGRLENLDSFYRDGVRFMTVVHDRDNEIGFNQRSGADGPLTPFGVQVVERMNVLGMVVDVAHAKSGTLKSIAEVSVAPLIDSHTGPYLSGEEGRGPRRLRSWQEMEWVAKTGGVVCTWPLAFSAGRSERATFQHWAQEIVLMKSRLGIEHCGLGTDGGGGLSPMIRGWESIVSLPLLVAALREAGLSQQDIGAFVGGNFLRILQRVLA